MTWMRDVRFWEFDLDRHQETQAAWRAWSSGDITPEDIHDDPGVNPFTCPPVDIRVAYRRAKERRAAAELQADIMAGKVPDWPAWSELMAGVPL